MTLSQEIMSWSPLQMQKGAVYPGFSDIFLTKHCHTGFLVHCVKASSTVSIFPTSVEQKGLEGSPLFIFHTTTSVSILSRPVQLFNVLSVIVF